MPYAPPSTPAPNPNSHAKLSFFSSRCLSLSKESTEKAIITAAKAPLTTGSGAVLRSIKPNGMPSMVGSTSHPALRT